MMTADRSMFTAATVQFKPTPGPAGPNLEPLLSLAEIGAPSNTALFVFPEMCTTGYLWPNSEAIRPYAEPADGSTFQAFSRFCRGRRCYAVYGFAENDSGALYNSQNLVGPNGELIFTYRKTHLFQADTLWALPGNTGFITADTQLGLLGAGICMDLNFDDFIDFHIASKTDYLLFATNWLEQGIDVHAYWEFRLAFFKGTVFMADTWGFEGEVEFAGRSAVWQAGEFIAAAPHTGNCVLVTTHPYKKK